jgi:hypothetical protein
MRIQDLDEGVGRIVKGVNTTPDVDVNQTSKEAAKFGFKVDKDGRPPLITKKSKNNSNTMFNLGLTEGIKLKLERDKHIDVLHIMDTEDKQRIEVRGKKGYESGNYDANDKLHQVLDRVGKAANISELMNGEVVSINPNHPQGTRAIRTARDVLQTEEQRFTAMEQACIEGGHSIDDLDKPTPTIAELVKMHGVPAKVILDQLTQGIEAEYEHTSDFEVAKQIAMDHLGEDPYYYDKLKFIESSGPQMNPADIAADTRASSTGVSPQEMQRLINDYRPQPPRLITRLLNNFDADTVIGIALAIGAPHLSFLHKFLLKRGIRFSRNVMQRALAQVESIEENFADGKKKGKSRPGRVKRAGASCNGSVTSLRKRAKNSSGEKAKMYHWCANMKSGKKKK